MKRTNFLLFFLGLVSLVFAQNIYVAGSGMNRIVKIDKASGQTECVLDTLEGECNSIDMTPKGELLYSYKHGARLVDLKNKKTVWNYTVETGGELHCAKVLPHGRFLLAISGDPAMIVELDKKGKEERRVLINGESSNYHGQFRQIQKSRNGNYLVPLLSAKKLREITPEGAVVREISLSFAPFSVVELTNGNLILSGGDAHFFAEYDRQTGAIIRKVERAMKGDENMLHYVAQVAPLKSGNLLICNWNGHFKKGEARVLPHLIELTPEGDVQWTFSERDQVKLVSCCYVEPTR